MRVVPAQFRSVAATIGAAIVANLVLFAGAATAALPDGRAYELVSHADMWGQRVFAPDDLTSASDYARVEDSFTGPSSSEYSALNPVAPDGEVVLYSTFLPIPGFDTMGRNDVFRAHRTSNGWVTKYTGPDDVRAASLVDWHPNLGQLYWMFQGAPFDPADTDPALPEGSAYKDLYRRASDGSFTWLNQPVLSPDSDVLEWVYYGGSSADGTHVVFASSRQLTPDAPPSNPDEIGPDAVALYERVGDVTRLVTVKPGGGAFTLGPGSAFSNAFGGISKDGSRIVFEARSDGSTPMDVWVRVNGAATLEASRSRLPSPGTPQPAHFEAMSSDGSRVVFVTAERLLGEDQDSSADLYAYDVPSDSLELVSAGAAGQGNSDDCSNTVLSRCDVEYVNSTSGGSLVYFVSAEQLAEAEGVPGQLNLYVRSLEDDTTKLVATLSNADWSIPGTSGELDDRSRVTADDSKLIFESAANLTPPYDAAGKRQVYVYDAGSGEIECASCRPDGEPPSAESYLVTPAPILDGQAADARPSAADQFDTPNATSDGGMVFFESGERLVADDINSEVDVYRYDTDANDLALISSGRGSEGAIYFGNSADGRDVFFLSVERLVPEAINGPVMKLYDARIGGGFEAAPPKAPCGPGDCQGEPTAPPGELEPGSGTYSGPGNPTAHAPACGRLERKAKRLHGRAKRLSRKARHADGARHKRLRKGAQRARREARQAMRELRACKRGGRR